MRYFTFQKERLWQDVPLVHTAVYNESHTEMDKLQIDPDEETVSIAVCGRKGVGKTTFINSLLDLHKGSPTEKTKPGLLSRHGNISILESTNTLKESFDLTVIVSNGIQHESTNPFLTKIAKPQSTVIIHNILGGRHDPTPEVKHHEIEEHFLDCRNSKEFEMQLPGISPRQEFLLLSKI